jgi:hypothetical protein
LGQYNQHQVILMEASKLMASLAGVLVTMLVGVPAVGVVQVAALVYQRLAGVLSKAVLEAVVVELLPLRILQLPGRQVVLLRDQTVVEALVEPQPLTALLEQVGRAAVVQVHQPRPQLMSAALVALVQAAAVVVLHEALLHQSVVLAVLAAMAWFVFTHGEAKNEIRNYRKRRGGEPCNSRSTAGRKLD